ncbi:hypothetical protein [Streptomyces sp. NPDC052042]|uniref:hypothetical protein n=1 Tax=Streptomyces sp. NPDC052042 TaxID=3365683 RepID=UPI0037CE32C9
MGLTMNEVVGYSYQAEVLCPSCTITSMRVNGIVIQRGKTHEEAIRRAAERIGVSVDDEHSYDSGDFPKAVTKEMARTELTGLSGGEHGTIPDERCTACGRWLVLGRKSPSETALARYVRDAYELPHALAKNVATELKKWGLSHPEFIGEENARQAAAMFPHDFAAVEFRGNPQRVVMLTTPQFDGDVCFCCEKPWEDHVFTCGTCGIDVPAVVLHRHEIPVRGQRRLPVTEKESVTRVHS